MKTSYAAAFVLVLLCAGFVGYWAWSGSQLPERVASHFNASGEANGWMTRTGYQNFMLLFGLGLPLFVLGACFMARFLPASLVNLPHRAYWLAPERKTSTNDYVFVHSLWLACLVVGLELGMQYSVVQANRQTPPHLPVGILLGILVPFVAGTGVWTLALVRHFRRPGRL